MNVAPLTLEMVREGTITPVKYLESSVIEHPRFAVAKARALKLPSRTEQRLEARILTITGNPGAGKTTFLRNIEASLRDERGDRTVRHAVYFQTPKLPTWRSLASAMLGGLDPNFRVPKGWNSTDVIHALKPIVAAKEVTLWLGDEGHRLITRRARAVQKDTADFIVQVLNELNVSLVMCGLSELMRLVEVEGVEDGILGRRRDAHFHLAAYNWMDVHGRAHFLGFLSHLEQRLILPKPSRISDERFAARLYVATCGQPGLVVKLLSEALSRALEQSLDCITAALLAEVYDDFVFGDDDEDDLPWEMDFKPSHEELAREKGANRLDPYLVRHLPPEENPMICDADELARIWRSYRVIGLSPMSGKSVAAAC